MKKPQTMHDRLRQARQDAGFRSARAAASQYGCKLSTYGAHENGQNDYSPETAAFYGKAFRVSPAWLLTGEAPNKEREPIAARSNSQDELASLREKISNFLDPHVKRPKEVRDYLAELILELARPELNHVQIEGTQKGSHNGIGNEDD